MTERELRTYVDGRERAPFESWFLNLDRQAQAKVAIALSRLERGNTSNVEAVGDGVAELKLNWGPGYRIYFGQDGKIDHHSFDGRHEEAAKPGYCRRERVLDRL